MPQEIARRQSVTRSTELREQEEAAARSLKPAAGGGGPGGIPTRTRLYPSPIRLCREEMGGNGDAEGSAAGNPPRSQQGETAVRSLVPTARRGGPGGIPLRTRLRLSPIRPCREEMGGDGDAAGSVTGAPSPPQQDPGRRCLPAPATPSCTR